MTFLDKQNVGGQDYRVQTVMPIGACSTPAGSEVKVCTFSDSFDLVAGTTLMIQFTYANTYGDGSTTYPKLQVNGTSYAIKLIGGGYASNGAWGNGALLTFAFNGVEFVFLTVPVVDTVTANNMNSVSSNAVAASLQGKAGIETGSFSLNFLRSTVQTLSGSYVKIGSVVFANVRVQVTATTSGNDYVNLPSNVPAMDALKGCFGSWRTEEYNGYGTIQNSGSTSIWFIYDNQEFNVGQKAIDGNGALQIELIYFT